MGAGFENLELVDHEVLPQARDGAGGGGDRYDRLAHAGAAILLVLAAGWPRVRAGPAPPLERTPITPFAVSFTKVFALVPGLLATIFAVLVGQTLPLGGAAPLVVLSGLAIVIAAGDSIALYHQRVLGFAWAGLLVVPVLFIPLLIVLLPWTAGTDLQASQPANAMGRYFADTFERRTGQPLAVVTGDPRTAALIALAAPSITSSIAVRVSRTSTAAGHQGLFSRSCRRTAAHLRAAGARPAAAVTDRLGRDPAGQRGAGALR